MCMYFIDMFSDIKGEVFVLLMNRSFFNHLGATAVNGVLTIHQRYSVGVVNEPQVLDTAAFSYVPS